jgi:hypothetical protein
MMHVIGHRYEATMRYLTATWKAADVTNYWDKFAATQLYNGTVPTSAYCGNAHYTANSTVAYDYSNTSKTAANNCGDFGNFPNYSGVTATGNCSLWGCTESGWDKYWLKNVPMRSGSVSMTSKSGKTFVFPKNWWSLWLYPEAAITQRAKM